jgi:F-type H+/Na+-transporting ATPase subunit beta
MSSGKIVEIIGAVVDVEFPHGEVPKIYDALTLENGLTLEVQQQLGDGVVRTIAMGTTEGVKRQTPVTATGKPISVPVGKGTLGRVMDVLGRPVDNAGDVEAQETWSIHRKRAGLRRIVGFRRTAGDRHQGNRPDLSLRQGG